MTTWSYEHRHNVFCKDCRHSQPYDPSDIHMPLWTCKSNPRIVLSPVGGAILIKASCFDKNRDFNCSEFEPKAKTRLQKFRERIFR